jgi:hypothetical protein
MGSVSINASAVMAAAMVKIAVEFIWHGPLFGTVWMRLAGLTSGKIPMGMGKAHFFSLIGSIAMSYVLAYSLAFSTAYLNISGLYAGIMCGFLNWLGFIAPVTLGGVVWEGKPWKLWMLLNSSYLVSLLSMGVLLALWK